MSFSALLRLWLVHLFCVAGLVGLRRHLLLKPGQLWQSGEISGGQRHDEAKPCAFNAAINGLDGASDGFGPAESLLDPFAVPEGTSVALYPVSAREGAVSGSVETPAGRALCIR